MQTCVWRILRAPENTSSLSIFWVHLKFKLNGSHVHKTNDLRSTLKLGLKMCVVERRRSQFSVEDNCQFFCYHGPLEHHAVTPSSLETKHTLTDGRFVDPVLCF